jgi:hypothetical protein
LSELVDAISNITLIDNLENFLTSCFSEKKSEIWRILFKLNKPDNAGRQKRSFFGAAYCPLIDPDDVEHEQIR